MNRAVQTLTEVLKKYCADICEYCKHQIPCLIEKCDKYESGVGMHDEKGQFFKIKWACLDFDYGSCEKLKGTPCEGCFERDYENFDWKG